MHELSIALSMVQVVTEHAERAGAARVLCVAVRIGWLAGIEEDPLRLAFALLTEDTLAAGAELQIHRVPVTVFCSRCAAELQVELQLPGLPNLSCPQCGHPSGEIRRGRELDIVSIEIVEADDPRPV